MTPVISFLTLPTTLTLGWTLVHFLWQGTLVALVAAAVLRWLAPSARARYLCGVATLAILLATPLATFAVLQMSTPAAVAAAASQAGATDVLTANARDAATDAGLASALVPATTPIALPFVVVLWIAGVVVLSVRLLGGWMIARRLATAAGAPVDAALDALAQRIADRLGLRQLVRVAESSTLTVPVVIGWLKPVVLVPAGAVSGLAPAHLEALLAHELAHVRRHDYLVNLLQSVVDTVLFYHPAVWWVSRRVRVEREHCCDDLAVTVCDRVVYVDALADLAARTMHARLALAATDGSLLGRVRRLLEARADERPASGWLSIGVVIMIAASLTPTMLALSPDGQRSAPAPVIEVPAIVFPEPIAVDAVAQVSGDSTVSVTPELLDGTVSVTPELSPLVVTANDLHVALQTTPAELPRIVVPESAQSTPLEVVGILDAKLRDLAGTPALPEPPVVIETTSPQVPRVKVGGEIRAPQMLKRVEPMYPPVAKAAKIQGPVHIEAVIGTDGRVIEARATAGHPSEHLREAALTAVRQWVYTPTLVNGSPVEVQLSVQVMFRLNDDSAATMEQVRMLTALQRALVDARARYAQDHPEVVRLEREIRNLEVVEFARRLEQAKAQARQILVTDPAELIRRGDTLDIAIAGEDQLPRQYVVGPEGMIRLPLIGPVGVVDVTAGQARDWIAKLLAERKLAEGRAVTVLIYQSGSQPAGVTPLDGPGTRTILK